MEITDKIKIAVERIPLISFRTGRAIIKLPDSAYGEWLLFNNNEPVFYLNIFDNALKEIKNKFDAEMLTIEKFVDIINVNTKENFSTKYKYCGFINWHKRTTQEISISKIPFEFLEFFSD